jgi:hypothetical protein
MDLGVLLSTSYGVRTKRNGSGAVEPFGRKMAAWSLTPSRAGVITSWRVYSGSWNRRGWPADFARIAGAVHSDIIEASDISFCGADELQGDRNVERREGIVGLRDEFEAHATTRFMIYNCAIGNESIMMIAARSRNNHGRTAT